MDAEKTLRDHCEWWSRMQPVSPWIQTHDPPWDMQVVVIAASAVWALPFVSPLGGPLTQAWRVVCLFDYIDYPQVCVKILFVRVCSSWSSDDVSQLLSLLSSIDLIFLFRRFEVLSVWLSHHPVDYCFLRAGYCSDFLFCPRSCFKCIWYIRAFVSVTSSTIRSFPKN